MLFSAYGFRVMSGPAEATRRPTRSRNCHGSHVLIARRGPNSSSAWGSWAVQFGRSQQFPSQMIHVKNEKRLRKALPEILVHPLFPSFGKKRLRVHIFGEEPVFMRHSQEIQNRRDH